MTEIFLIRHTQAEGNIYRAMQGHWDGGVTPAGRLQQQSLRERFRDVPVDAVYSSDLSRAVFTAEAVAEPKGLAITTDVRLREINVGPWEMGFFGNVFHADPVQAEYFVRDSEKWYIEGAETYAQVRERVYAGIEDIAKRNDGKRIAIVSHGVSIRCFCSKVTGIPLTDTVRLPIFRNTSVSTFTYENGVFTPVELNSYRHIESLPLPLFNKTDDLRHECIDPKEEREYYEACYADCWLAAHGDPDGFSPAPYFHSAQEHYAHDPHSLMKLYDGDEAVGIVELDTARCAEDGVGWVCLLYLKESFRGKGYGIQALARPILYYKKLGRRALRLHVAEDNLTAIRFYENNGFYRLGKDGRLILMEYEL
ncbi:MAG: bifunctional histidine phosphatase family protein/GNAT family N-acetyltransferase [Eubacteriales bacterium]|nr:bifunctional histidine phosphatase family protein/GNAT family N-acetyltransferase [Eubacteriales bacterium]